MKKAYPTYKETEIPWLPEMPSSWRQVKFKYLFNERVEKGYSNEPLLAATQTQGVIPKEMYETRTVTAQKDFHLLKLVRVGDFVISLRSFQGGIEYAHFQGIISPAYTILKPLYEVHGGYFRHLLKSKNFIDDLTTYVTGIREGQNINYSDLRDALAPIPTLPEQRQIAAYLDHKCALIDTFIAKKKRLIELLREQKQAIINQAVTRGIDPDAPLKPSGVDWLGEIPARWEVKKLKYVAEIKGRIGFRGYTTDDLVPEGQGALVLGASHITFDGKINLEKPVFISWEKYYESPEIMVQTGDLLIVQRGSTCGKVGLIESDIGPATINPSLVLIKNIKSSSGYLLYYLRAAINDILNLVSSTAIPMLSQMQIGNIVIALPPHFEQYSILSHIREETEKVDEIIERINKEITLIQEYKTTLIAEAVTGKIDVREWRAASAEPAGKTVAYDRS